MDRNGTLVALFAEFLIDLQIKRAVSQRDAAVDAFSAADAQITINHVLEKRRLDITAPNCSDRTKLVFGAGVPGDRLRIEKARTEIAVSTHLEIVETFDRRDVQDATIGTAAATDAAFRINLPSRRVGVRLFFDGEKTRETGDSDRRQSTAASLQKIT